MSFCLFLQVRGTFSQHSLKRAQFLTRHIVFSIVRAHSIGNHSKRYPRCGNLSDHSCGQRLVRPKYLGAGQYVRSPCGILSTYVIPQQNGTSSSGTARMSSQLLLGTWFFGGLLTSLFSVTPCLPSSTVICTELHFYADNKDFQHCPRVVC